MVELDSDTLYILATGFSVLSILVVFVARYYFGSSDSEDETSKKDQKQLNDKLSEGSFAPFPVAEWKQRKLALEKEYREHFMDPSKLPEWSDKDETSPLLVGAEADEGDEQAAARVSTGKVVRFKSTVEEHPESVERPSEDSGNEHEANTEDQDLEDVLKEKLGEEELAHLPARLKSVKLRKVTQQVEEELTDEQKLEEARIRNQQLESIFQLMREQEEKFGVSSMEDIEEQLKLYSF